MEWMLHSLRHNDYLTDSNPIQYSIENNYWKPVAINSWLESRPVQIENTSSDSNSSSGGFPVNVFNLTMAQPMTPADISMFSVGLLICLVNLFFAFSVLINSRYKAVKTKQPKMMAFSVILGSLTFIAFSYTNDLIENHKNMCTAINVWLLFLSMIGWLSCISTRLVTIFVLFNIMLKFQIKRKIPTFVWFLITMVPCVLACILGTIFDINVYVKPKDGIFYSCQYNLPGFSTFVAIILFYLVFLITMSILTINVRRAYSDTRIEVGMLVIIILSMVFVAVCFSIRLNLLVPIRIIIAYVPIFLSTTYFYAVMYRVVWYTLRSWLGCTSMRRDTSFFEDWDMRFFLESNNTIFSNDQIRRIMNLESATKANISLNPYLHQKLLTRDDDESNSPTGGRRKPIGASGNSEYYRMSEDNSSKLSPMRSLLRVMGHRPSAFVSGDEVVTEEDIIQQAVVNNVNAHFEDYRPKKLMGTELIESHFK